MRHLAFAAVIALVGCGGDDEAPADATAPGPDAARADAAPPAPDASWVDSDGDGIPDVKEGDDDFDGDGLPNDQDLDSDGDGISDAIEAGDDPLHPVSTDGTDYDFLDLDADDDGLPDACEDPDGDGVLDAGETDRLAADTDGDGFPDGVEALGGGDPSDPDVGVPPDAPVFIVGYYDPADTKSLTPTTRVDLGTVDVSAEIEPPTLPSCFVGDFDASQFVISIDPALIRDVPPSSTVSFDVSARNTTVEHEWHAQLFAADLVLTDGTEEHDRITFLALIPCGGSLEC